MSRLFRWRWCGLASAALVLCSCDATGVDFNDLQGSVVTLVDSAGPQLGTARTFVVPDTVVEVNFSVGGLNHVADREITSAIRQHFIGMGWTDVAASGVRPDVLVLAAAGTRIQTGVYYEDWYGSWGYLPYWSPAVNSTWGWGVPSTAIPYAFPAGTLFITLLDLRDQREETRSIPLLWAAVVDGVLTSASNSAERALLGVDQAFAQSAYLERAIPQ